LIFWSDQPACWFVNGKVIKSSQNRDLYLVVSQHINTLLVRRRCPKVELYVLQLRQGISSWLQRTEPSTWHLDKIWSSLVSCKCSFILERSFLVCKLVYSKSF